jgi:DNA-binding NarL/FixJ family response regulator
MKNLKFIIVDDNADFRQGLKELLESEYSSQVIDYATNGREFLNLIQNFKADIILMDLFMPELSGFEAAKPFIWSFPQSKVLANTLYIDKVNIKQLIEIGFKGCIYKQYIFEEIEVAVKTVLEGKLYFPDYLKIK